MPAAPWMANVLAGRAPGTITVRPPVQGGGLALPVSNVGSRGQDARYYLGNLRRLDNGYYTDGTYTYDQEGLSVDRPNSFVPGLPPADESERWDVWRPPSVGASSGGPPPTPPPFSNPPLPGLPPFSNPPVYTGPTRPVSPGVLPGFGVLPGGVPSAKDWVRQPGFYESDTRDPVELGQAPPVRYEGAANLATLQKLLRGRPSRYRGL